MCQQITLIELEATEVQCLGARWGATPTYRAKDGGA